MGANIMKVSLDADTSGFVDGLNKIKSEGKNLNRELKGLQKEIQTMSIAYDEMDEEARKSKFGEYLKEQIDIATQEAGRLKDIQADIQQNIKNIASDTADWDAFKQGFEVAGSSVQAFAATMGIAKEDGTLMANALNMITMAQTATNAAITIGNALQKQSALMIGLRRGASIADAAATKIVTAALAAHATAMGTDTVATGAATVATKLFRAALISTGIGAIIVAIGSLIAYWDDLTAAAKKAWETMKEGIQVFTDWIGVTSEEERQAEAAKEAEEKRKKAIEDVNASAYKQLQSEAQQIAKLQQLQKTINNVNLSEKQRVKAMEDANKESGKEIYNLKETQKYLSGMDKSISAYISNMVKEAKAKALLTKIGELYVQQLEVEEYARKNGSGPWSRGRIKQIQAEIDMYTKEVDAISKSMTTYKAYSDTKSNAGGASGKSGSKSTSTKKTEETPEQKAAKDIKAAVETYAKEKKRIDQLLADNKDNGKGIYGEGKYEQDLKKIKDNLAKALESNYLYLSGDQKVMLEKVLYDVNDINASEVKRKLDEELTKAYDKSFETVAEKSSGFKMPQLFDSQEDKLASEAQEELNNAITKYNDLLKTRDALEEAINQRIMSGALDVESDAFKNANDRLEELNEQLGTAKGNLDNYAASYTNLISTQKIAQEQQAAIQKSIDAIANGFSSLGQAIGGTEGEWLSFVGSTISSTAQMISQLAELFVANQAVAMAKGVQSASGLMFPFNLAAIATVVAGILSVFASMPKFATGGIIPGSSTIGDKQLVRVNSGEMVLNTRQQSRLFRMLNGAESTGSASPQSSEVRIQGSDLYIALKNYGKMTPGGIKF